MFKGIDILEFAKDVRRKAIKMSDKDAIENDWNIIWKDLANSIDAINKMCPDKNNINTKRWRLFKTASRFSGSYPGTI